MGVGNRVRCDSHRIDDAILWQIVATDAPASKAVVESMLERRVGDSAG